jgi:hypothetical protein
MFHTSFWCYSLIYTRVEAGSNISTVTLRVAGDDEKGVSNLRQ